MTVTKEQAEVVAKKVFNDLYVGRALSWIGGIAVGLMPEGSDHCVYLYVGSKVPSHLKMPEEIDGVRVVVQKVGKPRPAGGGK